MNASSHISFEILADIAENRATGAELAAGMDHVSSCSECDDILRQLQHLLVMMRTDASEDAPADLVRAAMTFFSSDSHTPVRRSLAVLTFDSRKAGSAFGMRSIRTASRQLLYSAQDTDVDLRISVQKKECVLSGQIIREGCHPGVVEISGAAGSATAALNELCEFALPPIPVGSYSLKVKMTDVEIEIPELELDD